MNKRKNLSTLGTGINYMGFAVIVIDALTSGSTRAFAMTPLMIVAKMVGLCLIVLGTTVFRISSNCENTNDTSEKNGQQRSNEVWHFMCKNAIAYLGVVWMFVYLLSD